MNAPEPPPSFSEALGVFAIIGLALYAFDPGLFGLGLVVFGIPLACWGLDALTRAARDWLRRLGKWEP